MGEAEKRTYFPQESADVDCPAAVPYGSGSYMCGILKGRKCGGKLQGKTGGKKYKCKVTTLDIELR